MLKNRKFGHVGFAVDKLEEDVQWYKEVMGFEEIGKFPIDGEPAYFLKSGDMIYELYTDNNLPEGARGLVDHICYDSDDIEADWEYCKAQGFKFIDKEIVFIPEFWSNGYRYFMIETPAGDKVEFGQIL